jgi:CRP/FNR family transcriptional regulator
MRSICMPQGLTPEECKRMEALICLSRTIKQGETIYRTNDSFQSIYVVGAGSCKTVLMRDRRER